MTTTPNQIELLARDFLEETYYEQAQPTTILEFLNEYTLHDSEWQDFYLEPTSQSAVVLFLWDTIWSKERLPYPPFQYLYIYFEEVFQIVTSKNRADNAIMNTVSMATSRVIPMEEREAFLNLASQVAIDDQCFEHYLDDQLHHTKIKDILGGQINIIHGPKIQVLCVHSETSGFLSIPDIECNV